MRIELNEIAKNALITAQKRENNGANLRINDILKHCAGEVIEAAEARAKCGRVANSFAAYSEELADIVICVLIAAARDGVDIENALNEKMAKNAKRAALQGEKL